jgi:NTE family protein
MGKMSFVLGGGGARGALQVGALQALLEADIRPDLLVGTSVGAINAAFIAMRGFSVQGLEELRAAWQAASQADLLPSNYLWLTVRTLFGRIREYPFYRLKDFYIAQGISPDLKFKHLDGPELFMVAADMNRQDCFLYGEDPEHSVLEGLLASTALPPWSRPLNLEGRYLMDGGVVSNLPVEPALSRGATQIIALDLADPRVPMVDNNTVGVFLNKLMGTVIQRQTNLELALADAQGVQVERILLQSKEPIPIYDFKFTLDLIQQGYEITRKSVVHLERSRRPWWRRLLWTN